MTGPLKLVPVTLVIVCLALPLSNVAISRWQHARNPVPGGFYLVNGLQMHLYCAGTGAPTILIEAGASADWLGWQGVQAKLSPLTRVCTYDRAGHGWSEPRAGPRTAEAIAGELHGLLSAAAVQRPLVLAGHSAGGFYVREYAREFPREVAGAVLIDSSSPQQIDELPGWRTSWEADKRDVARRLPWEKLRVWSGWERLTGGCRNDPSPELKYLADQYNAEMCRPAYVGGEDSELPDFEESSRQAARLKSFGNVPLLVLSQDDRPRPGVSPDALAEQKVWSREQESFKTLSPRSWRVIALATSHAIHHDRLDLVVAEMTLLISYLRGGTAPPFGNTVSE